MVSENAKRIAKVSIILVLTMMAIMFLYSPYYYSTITNYAVRDLNELEIFKEGNWTRVYGRYVGGSALYSDTSGSAMYTEFEGNVVSITIKVGPDAGMIRVILDNNVTIYDLYEEKEALIKRDLASNLAPGVHTLKIAVINRKNGLSAGTKVLIDEISIDKPTKPTGYGLQPVEESEKSFAEKADQAFISLSSGFADTINPFIDKYSAWLADKSETAKEDIVAPMSVAEDITSTVTQKLKGTPFMVALLLLATLLVGSYGYYVWNEYELDLMVLVKSMVDFVSIPFRLVRYWFESFTSIFTREKETKKTKKIKIRVKTVETETETREGALHTLLHALVRELKEFGRLYGAAIAMKDSALHQLAALAHVSVSVISYASIAVLSILDSLLRYSRKFLLFMLSVPITIIVLPFKALYLFGQAISSAIIIIFRRLTELRHAFNRQKGYAKRKLATRTYHCTETAANAANTAYAIVWHAFLSVLRFIKRTVLFVLSIPVAIVMLPFKGIYYLGQCAAALINDILIRAYTLRHIFRVEKGYAKTKIRYNLKKDQHTLIEAYARLFNIITFVFSPVIVAVFRVSTKLFVLAEKTLVFILLMPARVFNGISYILSSAYSWIASLFTRTETEEDKDKEEADEEYGEYTEEQPKFKPPYLRPPNISEPGIGLFTRIYEHISNIISKISGVISAVSNSIYYLAMLPISAVIYAGSHLIAGLGACAGGVKNIRIFLVSAPIILLSNSYHFITKLLESCKESVMLLLDAFVRASESFANAVKVTILFIVGLPVAAVNSLYESVVAMLSFLASIVAKDIESARDAVADAYAPLSTLSKGVFHQAMTSLSRLVTAVFVIPLRVYSRAAVLAERISSSVVFVLTLLIRIFAKSIEFAWENIMSGAARFNEFIQSSIGAIANVYVHAVENINWLRSSFIFKAKEKAVETVEVEPRYAKKPRLKAKSHPKDSERLDMLAEELDSEIETGVEKGIRWKPFKPLVSIFAPKPKIEQKIHLFKENWLKKVESAAESESSKLDSYLKELDSRMSSISAMRFKLPKALAEAKVRAGIGEKFIKDRLAKVKERFACKTKADALGELDSELLSLEQGIHMRKARPEIKISNKKVSRSKAILSLERYGDKRMHLPRIYSALAELDSELLKLEKGMKIQRKIPILKPEPAKGESNIVKRLKAIQEKYSARMQNAYLREMDSKIADAEKEMKLQSAKPRLIPKLSEAKLKSQAQAAVDSELSKRFSRIQKKLASEPILNNYLQAIDSEVSHVEEGMKLRANRPTASERIVNAKDNFIEIIQKKALAKLRHKGSLDKEFNELDSKIDSIEKMTKARAARPKLSLLMKPNIKQSIKLHARVDNSRLDELDSYLQTIDNDIERSRPQEKPKQKTGWLERLFK